MNKRNPRFTSLKWLALVAFPLLFAQVTDGQTYYPNNVAGDVVAGFRKTGSFAENNEMVVRLGNVTNFLKLTIGTTITITNYSAAQLANMCPDNFANLQWSVFSTFPALGFSGSWTTPLGTFPSATCWYTLPRTDASTQTTPPVRYSATSQGPLRGAMLGVGNGGNYISQALVTTNAFNNILLVTEPVSYTDYLLTTYIGDRNDSTIGDFGGTTFPYSVENTTSDPFSSPSRCDFYQSCPAGVNQVDPLSSTTNGAAYYVGYFTLNTDGTMSFTRAAQSVVSNPPPKPILSIASSVISGGGGAQVNSIISFSTTNGATYTLYYTNSAGLNSPVTNWATLPGTVTGDGAMHAFTNASSDPSRFYVIGAH